MKSKAGRRLRAKPASHRRGARVASALRLRQGDGGRAEASAKVARRKNPKNAKSTRTAMIASVEVEELDSMRQELDRLARKAAPPRWNADPEDVRRSVAKLVLTLVEFIRQLLERQAIRRMDAGTLTPEQIESVGLALMRLEETIRDIGGQFGLAPEDLNLDLGPVGKLM
jgi:Gas vesicle protein K